MYDQSFNHSTLRGVIQRGDFLTYPPLRDVIHKEVTVQNAVKAAESMFSGGNPVSSILVAGKTINRVASFSDKLVIRKIDRNIKRISPTFQESRSSIVSNVKSLLSEGVPYRSYRLDVKSFFESFPKNFIIDLLHDARTLSTPTKQLTAKLLDQNGPGLPRGLSISSSLSELAMIPFDAALKKLDHVFFYARFVDDILIVTSGDEPEGFVVDYIEATLPAGLTLNRKKLETPTKLTTIKPYDANKTKVQTFGQGKNPLLSMEYLGYAFEVYDPPKTDTPRNQFRTVRLDISESKRNKIKKRIVLAVYSYCKNKNFQLLENRLNFLTSNFSIEDKNRDQKRLAGLYYNYYLITDSDADGLKELDCFLRAAVLSNKGRTFARFYKNSTPLQRRQLLTHSFVFNFRKEAFVHHTAKQLKQIQRCWKYA
ncbi:antiviral reverse transcriptase Drt3a [Caballeronia sordidicola]|uniref:antiviral reverse transcriptase Drt3a n=1 Tax=Caballeronia sordidicola TaxID=196367 RepID=UPI0004D02637|nr:antiviral reverse transcriptase Drt3a [Caballeronia sordidicola]